MLALLAAPTCAQVTLTGPCVLTDNGACATSSGWPDTNYDFVEDCQLSNVPEVPSPWSPLKPKILAAVSII
jgi:hypothetical protein